MAKTTGKIDPVHSEIQFKVRHLMITTVTGHFRKYDLVVETEGDDYPNFQKLFLLLISIRSIRATNKVDTHLKSADFFHSAENAQIKFEGKKFEKSGDEYKLSGDLTIRGITKPITLNVDFGGIVADPYGQTKAGFTVEGKIRRKDFGLMWDAVTEAGQIVVSDEIRIHCEVQLVKQAQEVNTTETQAKKLAEA